MGLIDLDNNLENINIYSSLKKMEGFVEVIDITQNRNFNKPDINTEVSVKFKNEIANMQSTTKIIY